MPQPIDLRSDTLTLPTPKMLEAIKLATLGDDGRTTAESRGEDPTVNELEDFGAALTGKDAALFLPTGTMANHLAILTLCPRGSHIAIDEHIHLLMSEKAVFSPQFFGMQPSFYRLNNDKTPNLESLEQLFSHPTPPALISLENTHNYHGGIPYPQEILEQIKSIAQKYNVPLYMDGARVFNAAIALNMTVKDLVKPIDALMFCLSKGLGAPVGSLLCGSHTFIKKARQLRKYLGGTMRQAGVIAACGLEALKDDNIAQLKKDHQHAKLFAEGLKNSTSFKLDPNAVKTNIVALDFSHTNLNPQQIVADLKKVGVYGKTMGDNLVRFVFYRGISEEMTHQALSLVNKTLSRY